MAVAVRIGRDRRMWARMQPTLRPPSERRELNAELPIPKTTAEQAILQLKFHGGAARGRRRCGRRPWPVSLEKVAPGIRAKLAAFRRAMHFEESGSWVLPEEAEEGGETER